MTYCNVSIIVPAYNAQSTISECIQSLLDQDYPKDKYEIIIIDNNSKDETENIIKKFPGVIYLLEDNVQSAGYARNTGIKNASHDILAFTDSDCIAEKNWLKEGIKYFKDETIGGIGGKIKVYNPQTYIEHYQERTDAIFHAVSREAHEAKIARLATANAFFRKDIFDKVGLFDSAYGCEDTDLCWKMLRKTNYSLAYNPDAVVYHKHRSSLKELWTQFSKYGYGNAILYIRYKNALDTAMQLNREIKQFGFYKVLYWQLRLNGMLQKSFKVFFKALYITILPYSRKRKISAIDDVLTMYWQVASFYGYIKFHQHEDIQSFLLNE